MGSYNIVNKMDRLVLTLEGMFSEETAKKFVEDFMNEVKKINPSQHILEVYAGDLSVITKDMQQSLSNCFKLYQSIGFKKVIFYHKVNAILTMQVKRIATEAGLENFEIA